MYDGNFGVQLPQFLIDINFSYMSELFITDLYVTILASHIKYLLKADFP